MLPNVLNALAIELLLVEPSRRVGVHRVREADQVPRRQANIIRGGSAETLTHPIKPPPDCVRRGNQTARVLAEGVLGLVASLSPTSGPVFQIRPLPRPQDEPHVDLADDLALLVDGLDEELRELLARDA